MMRRPFYMDANRAKEFGVIDKVSALICLAVHLFFEVFISVVRV